MTITKAAEYLGVNRKVIYRLIRDGELHRFRDPILAGGPVRIPREDLDRLLAKRSSATDSP